MKKIFLLIIILLITLTIYFVLMKNTTEAPVVSVLPVVEENEESQYIEFDLSYPEIPEGKYVEMANFLKDSRQTFVNDFGTISEEDAQFLGLGENRKYSYFVNTKIATSTNTVSYIIEVYTYTGGAHGITSTATFTYNTEDQLVTLENLFTGTEYLKTVSGKAFDYFSKKFEGVLDEYSIREGTRPLSQNYNSWYLTDENVVFIFGQYSIGPYALGIQEFPLSKQEIKEIINQRYL